MTGIDLPIVWAGLIAFAVLAYVVLDGFDLGIGILFAAFPDRKSRDVMTNSIAPVWDGNETWLVLGGGGMMAVFPLAYSIIMPALYMPVILMLLGLVFRGVAFEFRWRSEMKAGIWDTGFWLGSTLAALMQGISLGTILQGIRVTEGAYAGGWWDWLTPFTLLTGVAVVVGYALLGATWLVLKTEGALHDRAQLVARYTALGLLAMIGLVSLATPFLQTEYARRWFVWPTAIYSAVVPVLVLAAAASLWLSLRANRPLLPFLSALALFLLSYAGLGISIWPDIVPGALTIHDAAAPDTTLRFLLWGAAILVPVILAYTGYAYWVFRGKIDPEEGYH